MRAYLENIKLNTFTIFWYTLYYFTAGNIKIQTSKNRIKITLTHFLNYAFIFTEIIIIDMLKSLSQNHNCKDKPCCWLA